MESEDLIGENKKYGLFQRYRYFKKGDTYYVYDVKVAETQGIKEVENIGDHTFLSFTSKRELIDYLKEINLTRFSRQKTCNCDIKYCKKSGINHIYVNETILIGKYCESCFSKIKGYFPDAIIKRFPLSGTAERIAQEIMERLHENGIAAVQTRDNGIKFTVPEENFNREEMITVIQGIKT